MTHERGLLRKSRERRIEARTFEDFKNVRYGLYSFRRSVGNGTILLVDTLNRFVTKALRLHRIDIPRRFVSVYLIRADLPNLQADFVRKKVHGEEEGKYKHSAGTKRKT
jgi:hypothetical protein